MRDIRKNTPCRWLCSVSVTVCTFALAASAALAVPPYVGSVDSVRDAVDGDTTVPCYGEIKMQGWAANPGGSGVRTSTTVRDCSPWATAACDVRAYQGSVTDVTWLSYQRTQLFFPRPDVQSAYGRSDFRPSGYTTYANVGMNWCPVGTRTYVGAAAWDAFGPYQLAGSGTLNVVFNDTVSTPGIVSHLDQAWTWLNAGTTSFWGDTSTTYVVADKSITYVNNYTRSSQAAWKLCAGATGKDAVWRFRLKYPTEVTIRTAMSAFDTVLYVVRSDNTQMGCNDDSEGTTQSRLDLILEPGDYYVFLDGYSSTSQGAFRLDFSWKRL